MHNIFALSVSHKTYQTFQSLMNTPFTCQKSLGTISHRQSSAYVYDNRNNSLIMVGGELCIDRIWCNNYSNKTLVSYNDGASFQEMAPIPALMKGHCAVLLDNTTLMVIGGYKFPISLSATYFLDLVTNSWSSGPSVTDERSYHTCNLIADCEGSQYVVVVGGTGTRYGDYRKSVEIYDVGSGTWSTGK